MDEALTSDVVTQTRYFEKATYRQLKNQGITKEDIEKIGGLIENGASAESLKKQGYTDDQIRRGTDWSKRKISDRKKIASDIDKEISMQGRTNPVDLKLNEKFNDWDWKSKRESTTISDDSWQKLRGKESEADKKITSGEAFPQSKEIPQSLPDDDKKEPSKKKPFANFKMPTLNSKTALKGLNATVAGLKAGGVATGALSNIMDTMRSANKAALHVDPLGTKTIDSALSITNKIPNDAQSALTGAANAVTSTKQNQKKITAATMKIPNLNRELDRIHQEAINKVGQGVAYEDMTSQQRQQVLETYEKDMDDFLTSKIGDWSKLDPNSEEAKAIKKKASEMTNLESYAGREQKLDQKQEKLDLKEKAQEQKDIKSDIRIDKINENVTDLRKIQKVLEDPNAPPDMKKLYDLAYRTDKNFMSKMANGMFTDEMNKKILNLAWSEYNNSTDENEKNILMNVINDLTWNRESLSEQKDWELKDVRSQRAAERIRKRTEGSVRQFLVQTFGNDQEALGVINDPVNSGRFLIPPTAKYINKVQDVLLPIKRKELVDKGIIINKDGSLVSDWSKMSQDDKDAYNEYKMIEHEVDVAILRSKMQSGIKNLNEAARTSALNKELKAIGASSSTGYEIKEIEKKIFSQVYQKEKDNFIAEVDEMLANHLETMRGDMANGKNVDIFANPSLKKEFERICNKHIAPKMSRDFGLYTIHVNGEPKQLTPTEIGNLILGSIGVSLGDVAWNTGVSMNTLGRMEQQQLQSPSIYADKDLYGEGGTVFVNGKISDPSGPFNGISIYDMNYDQLKKIHDDNEGRLKYNGGVRDEKYLRTARQIKRAEIGKLLMYAAIHGDDNTKRLARDALNSLSKTKWDTEMRNSAYTTVKLALENIQKSNNNKIYAGMIDDLGITNGTQLKFLSPSISSFPTFNDTVKATAGRILIGDLLKLNMY